MTSDNEDIPTDGVFEVDGDGLRYWTGTKLDIPDDDRRLTGVFGRFWRLYRGERLPPGDPFECGNFCEDYAQTKFRTNDNAEDVDAVSVVSKKVDHVAEFTGEEERPPIVLQFV